MATRAMSTSVASAGYGTKSLILLIATLLRLRVREWKEYKEGNYTYYSLYGADKKVVTGWVTITSGDPAGIDNITTTNTATNGIYNIGGMRLSKEIKDLPKGLYIVNGKKSG